ncbi:hypothetical protein H310_00372 [Aphanomyces invadans]|uniref:Uncharacterized protein n=1 Tax=Aphanomyces invadans TaxID=157072 RepID=A0A024UTX1_9STRA|nr:hypothetical protein H310_00372 [Aphanomyces invadans]ETW09951.1 hypothetical protein H310_00372 [Aphanomyces invadans]|eukprot:XP_008861362.1 hypothetical protein H310_00372 [Aphanomyces invadans]
MEATWYSVGGVGGFHLAHQLLASTCAVITVIVHVWLLAVLPYTFELRATIFPLCLYAYHITLAALLILATVGGMKAPIRWFGLMASFRGSGIMVMYFGLTALHYMPDMTVGVVAGYSCLGVGLMFAVVGQLHRERSSQYYTPLVYM